MTIIRKINFVCWEITGEAKYYYDRGHPFIKISRYYCMFFTENYVHFGRIYQEYFYKKTEKLYELNKKWYQQCKVNF